MVHARVLELYIHFALMYMTDHILPVLAIKDLMNEESETNMPLKIGKGTNPEVSHLWVLFFPCVLCKATAYIVTKKLNMNHQAQKGF